MLIMKFKIIVILLHCCIAHAWLPFEIATSEQLTQAVTVHKSNNYYSVIHNLQTAQAAMAQLTQRMQAHQFEPAESLVTACTQNRLVIEQLKTIFKQLSKQEEQQAKARTTLHYLTLSTTSLLSAYYLLQQTTIIEKPPVIHPLHYGLLGFGVTLVIGEIELGIEQAIKTAHAFSWLQTPKPASYVLNIINEVEQSNHNFQSLIIDKRAPDNDDTIISLLSNSERLRHYSQSLPVASNGTYIS